MHRPLVVGDLPFGSYQMSDEDAVRNAIRFVKEGGADVVKLEGAGPIVSRARAIVERRDPRDGPRRADAAVGDDARRVQDAGPHGGGGAAARRRREALEDAGCFSIVLEAVPSPVAARITRELSVPTIGIGAGSECDGQVLVYHDLLGLYGGPLPRFVKRYANLAGEIRDALDAYAGEVRSGAFPEEQHTYAMSEEEQAAFERSLVREVRGEHDQRRQ